MHALYRKRWICIIVALIIVLLVTSVAGEDSDALLKQVDKDLRQAEQDMFGGKTEKAIASLEIYNEIGDIWSRRI